MRVVLTLIGALVANLFKSPHRLEVENLFLRHQLSIALRRAPHRVHLRGCDRALLVWLTWFWPSLLGLSRVVQPETILRWHRAGFRAYWRWKSRGQPGLSLPKIRSANNNCVVRRGLGWRGGFHMVVSVVAAAHPYPIQDACASHCNTPNTRS